MNETDGDSKVGWIGLGKMGLPICDRLRDSGFQVKAFCRSEATAELAIAHRFAVTRTLAHTAAGCKFVVSAISDDHALLDIVLGAGGLKESLSADQIFVETSTVSPEASARVAEALQASGCAYLRAPVSGSTATAAQGALTALVSGPDAAFAAATKLFAAFTRKAFHVGVKEEARTLKLAINAMVGATSAMLSESLALARRGGLDDETVMSVILESAIASPLLQYKRGMVTSGDYPAAFSVSQMLKDFGLITQAAEAAACPMPLITSIGEQYRAAVAHGLGDRDFFVLTAKAP
jgi:3-hydroxyisobutyrate dehydrogenase-like beta-hydroxyacid dehydrogenase